MEGQERQAGCVRKECVGGELPESSGVSRMKKGAQLDAF